MAIDTVKLQSPYLTEEQAAAIHRACLIRQGVHAGTGEVQYQITSGSLKGTWDSSVSVRLWREEYVYVGGKPHAIPSEPYVTVEGSIHKAMLGQNVYGGPTDIQKSIMWFIADLSQRIECALPPYTDWLVRRVDWAECFILSRNAILEYMAGLKNCTFPRRKVRRYGLETVFFPGTTTTVKVYHKGPEFKTHDLKRLEPFIGLEVFALKEAADRRLRVEVGILPKKLDSLFGRKLTVSEVSDDLLIEIYDTDVARLIRDSASEMKIVRTNTAVNERLRSMYSQQTALYLFGVWMQLAGLGEEAVKEHMSKSSFYRARKKLVDAGVAWYGADVYVTQSTMSLPEDFSPMRADPRRCTVTPESTALKIENRGKLERRVLSSVNLR